jgi:hypothetical protein
MLSLHSRSVVVVLECYHFTVEVWWCWNVITSQWKCGGALNVITSQWKCGGALNVITSQWKCGGGAGMLSLHSGCVVTLESYHFTVDVW